MKGGLEFSLDLPSHSELEWSQLVDEHNGNGRLVECVDHAIDNRSIDDIIVDAYMRGCDPLAQGTPFSLSFATPFQLPRIIRDTFKNRVTVEFLQDIVVQPSLVANNLLPVHWMLFFLSSADHDKIFKYQLRSHSEQKSRSCGKALCDIIQAKKWHLVTWDLLLRLLHPNNCATVYIADSTCLIWGHGHPLWLCNAEGPSGVWKFSDAKVLGSYSFEYVEMKCASSYSSTPMLADFCTCFVHTEANRISPAPGYSILDSFDSLTQNFISFFRGLERREVLWEHAACRTHAHYESLVKRHYSFMSERCMSLFIFSRALSIDSDVTSVIRSFLLEPLPRAVHVYHPQCDQENWQYIRPPCSAYMEFALNHVTITSAPPPRVVNSILPDGWFLYVPLTEDLSFVRGAHAQDGILTKQVSPFKVVHRPKRIMGYDGEEFRQQKRRKRGKNEKLIAAKNE